MSSNTSLWNMFCFILEYNNTLYTIVWIISLLQAINSFSIPVQIQLKFLPMSKNKTSLLETLSILHMCEGWIRIRSMYLSYAKSITKIHRAIIGNFRRQKSAIKHIVTYIVGFGRNTYIQSDSWHVMVIVLGQHGKNNLWEGFR